MTDDQLRSALREHALLLGLKGDSRFKVRAYERAAESLEAFAEDLAAYVAQNRLTEIEGIQK